MHFHQSYFYGYLQVVTMEISPFSKYVYLFLVTYNNCNYQIERGYSYLHMLYFFFYATWFSFFTSSYRKQDNSPNPVAARTLDTSILSDLHRFSGPLLVISCLPWGFLSYSLSFQTVGFWFSFLSFPGLYQFHHQGILLHYRYMSIPTQLCCFFFSFVVIASWLVNHRILADKTEI